MFYRGRAPSGTATKWKMNEYRALEYAGPGATAGARSRADVATLPNPSGQVRNLYTLVNVVVSLIDQGTSMSAILLFSFETLLINVARN